MSLGILLDLQSDGIKFFSKVIFFIDPQSMFLESDVIFLLLKKLGSTSNQTAVGYSQDRCATTAPLGIARHAGHCCDS